jgi:hypothetical protein
MKISNLAPKVSVAAIAPPHMFARTPYYYYSVWRIGNYEIGLALSGAMFIPSFVKIGQLVQKPKVIEQRHKHRNTHTRRQNDLISLLIVHGEGSIVK